MVTPLARSITCTVLSVLVGWHFSSYSHAANLPSSETNVNPGINREYRKPDLNLNQLAERFEGESREIYAQRHEIVKAARIRPEMVVADVGAGTGLFTLEFARAVGPKGVVYAVDINTNMLVYIARRAAEAGLDNVRTVLSGERAIELPPNSVDLLFICDTYHHFEYPRSTMASLHRALKPGGELIIIDFKRILGQSPDWIFEHVRAGQEVFTAEIEAVGFRLVEKNNFLKENYFLRFKKTNADKNEP